MQKKKFLIDISATLSSYYLQRKHSKIYVRSKKSNICEEGAAHLRISFWRLLMNFKHKYLSKTAEAGQ